MVNIRHFMVFIFLSFLILLVYSCYKEPILPYQLRKVFIDSTCVSYFASFQKGSQWIYQQEGTLKMDTVREWSFENIFWYGDSLAAQNINYGFQEITIACNSTLTGDFWTFVACEDHRSNVFDYGFTDRSLFFDWPEEAATRESNGSFFGSSQATILDTLQVLNHTFTNVLCLKGYMGPGYSELYFVKNIGLVKRMTTNYPPFLLKDWTIKK